MDIKQGGNSYKTVTLKPDANGNWSTDVIIPAGAAKTYTVTETEPENHLWKASYQHKVGNGNLADGNVVTVPESMADCSTHTHTHTHTQNATVVITNTLKTAMLTNAIGVKKELVGRDWKDSDEFTFKLKADDSNPDAPMPASCKNQSACTVTVKRDSSDDHVAYFGDITYDAGEAEYTYLVTENAGNASAMYYSQAEYRVVVSVMKDGTSGEWKAVVESVTQLKTDYGARWFELGRDPANAVHQPIHFGIVTAIDGPHGCGTMVADCGRRSWRAGIARRRCGRPVET